MKTTDPFGIHWFRRDLRLAGNPALRWNWSRYKGRVVGLFCFDRDFLSRPDFSHNRFGFFLSTLRELKEEMRGAGGDLLVVDQGPEDAFRSLLDSLKGAGRLPGVITFNRDYEPFAQKRDAAIMELLHSFPGVEVHSERDHLLLEPAEIVKDRNSYYQIYSPFARRWFSLYATAEVQKRIDTQRDALRYLEGRLSGETPPQDLFRLKWKDILNKPIEDSLDSFTKTNSKKITIPLPEAGSAAAYRKLLSFSGGPEGYRAQRDFPAIPGTSQLSIYIKNGSLTTAQILAALNLRKEVFDTDSGRSQFVKEIVWREFYYHILFHCPRVEKEAFQKKFTQLRWENDDEYFQAWKDGRTGFPIVDAGMRQLRQTGWMHNRVRMIVASFLTKDLLNDWRRGEQYFMETLLDGDLAPNNGGWQWAASTGCDPQPYFRIFNPWLQSKKFDPEARYIKKWLPELEKYSPGQIHNWAGSSDHPAPIVEHDAQKKKALRLFGETNPS